MKNMILTGTLLLFTSCGTVETSTQKSEEPIKSSSIAKKLYQTKCSTCHGENGETSIQDKSNPIGGQLSELTLYQLQEYKEGNLDQYNMGNTMTKEAQLTTNEINMLSDYIASISWIDKEELEAYSNRETLFSTNTPLNIDSSDKNYDSNQDETLKYKRGEEIYKAKCMGCHGSKGEKKALGKSYIITQMKWLEVLNALQGYQKDIYGRSMKAIMRGQVKNLTKDELLSLTNYISFILGKK